MIRRVTPASDGHVETIHIDWEGRQRVADRMSKVEESVRNDYPDVELQLHPQAKKVELAFVRVPENLRRQGVGSDIVRRVTTAADELGVPTTLSVDDRFGTRKSELNKFYGSLGFKRDPYYGVPSRRIRYPGGVAPKPKWTIEEITND